MEVSRQMLRIFVYIFGTLVLVSYLYGLSHASDKDALWGGIPWSQAKFIVPFMFLAAFGFLMYWWIILYQNDASVIAELRWPWGESDGHGGGRLLFAFALLVIPSALWLEATIYHIENNYSWTPILVVGVLVLAYNWQHHDGVCLAIRRGKTTFLAEAPCLWDRFCSEFSAFFLTAFTGI